MDKNVKEAFHQAQSSGEAERPISQYKLDNCYTPNSSIYPLCRGKEGNKDCKECNVYSID